MTGLETFTPLVRTVTAGGQEIRVQPLRLGQMVAAAAAAKPLMALLWIGDFNTILNDLPGEARALLIHGLGLGPDQADALDGAEVIELLSAWHEVNADFLLRRLAPAGQAARQVASAVLDRLGPKAVATEARTGATSLPGSGSEDTGLPTALT